MIIMVLLTVSADEINKIQYKFTKTDSSYSFYGSFKINAYPACLLEIFFNYKHIKALAPDAKEVLLIEQGSDWHKIRYKYQKFIFFENISVWHRTLDIEKQRVDFILVSSENNQATMPRMISSSGFYRVNKHGEDIIVEYFQECQLIKTSITNLYLYRVKREVIQFMNWFSEYANTICSDKPVNDN
jgi:hypothetical protein